MVIIKNTRMVNNLRVENNIVVNRGPDASFVERSCARRVNEVPVEQVPGAGPGPRVTRDQLRIDPRKLKGGLRVVETTPEKLPRRVVRGDTRADMRSQSHGFIAAAGPPAAPKAKSDLQGVTPRTSASRPLDGQTGVLDRTRVAGGSVSTHQRRTSPNGFSYAPRPVRRAPPDRRIGMTSEAQHRDRLVLNHAARTRPSQSDSTLK